MPHALCKVFASLPLVERGASKVLGGDPKGINFLYTNNKSVIIRNIDNPEIADVYTEHAHQVQVAQYAPSGYYIASGDISGKIRIWDTTQKEHLLKHEYQPFSGTIKDICWSGDSQKVAVVGKGKEIYGAVFQWDTGTSVGSLTGHSKVVNSIAFKPNRPFRVVTGSDDYSCVFFEGLPLKFSFTINNHSRFVNCVRYSPDGTMFASAGADGQIFIYDGKTGSQICALGGDSAHSGGVYAVSWSPESKHLLSASGDKTVKLWDVEANSAVTTFNLGSDVLDQQLGCLWQNNHLMSVSLSGYINYLDKANPSKPLRVLKGHSKSIQSLTVHTDDEKQAIFSGSHDGHINNWNAQTGENDTFAGKGHTNQVQCMVVNDSNELVTCGMDDDVRFTNIIKKEYNTEDRVKMDAQPKGVAVGPGGYTVVVCIGQIVLLKDKKKVFVIENVDYDPRCVAIHPGGGTVAVGGNDSAVHLYSIQGNTLQKDCVLISTHLAEVLAMAYSPDGANLAVCSENRAITVFDVADGYKEEGAYYGHHAKVLCISWSPDNQHFATGGMDGLVFIWTLKDQNKLFKMPDAHRLYHVNCIAWLDEHTLVTSSPDACVKQWTITYN
ncbi:WD repeat-containing protein 1 [Scyliorhinus canicula]|uniref:WD repeat-containing protein 1 n=1 Tax=Scyliorhinus canicula TaxID=7830 RepID=UPI0018F690D5|nr:WD repeat-containing protein 1 [Scyliorhinus canicula]